MSSTVDNPFFARVWMFISTHEPETVARWRRENLAGLGGRVLEVGAGTGTNFPLYPDTVTEVVAVEPERRLTEIAQRAAEHHLVRRPSKARASRRQRRTARSRRAIRSCWQSP
jgi:protein-L-isoaspartate O-methyltransferase